MNAPSPSLKQVSKTSELLIETIDSLDGNHVKIGELIYQFQRRSYGGVLLILALLAMVPGISVFAGAAMIVPAYQLMIGLPAPVFPKDIRRRQIKVSALQKWGLKVAHWIAKLEQLIKPRWPMFTSPLPRRALGFVMIILALIVSIPFPFSNFPPSLAVIFFALGLLERDGLMICIGLILGILACVIGYVVFFVLIEWVMRIF